MFALILANKLYMIMRFCNPLITQNPERSEVLRKHTFLGIKGRQFTDCRKIVKPDMFKNKESFLPLLCAWPYWGTICSVLEGILLLKVVHARSQDVMLSCEAQFGGTCLWGLSRLNPVAEKHKIGAQPIKRWLAKLCKDLCHISKGQEQLSSELSC